ncbi:unnamed protein product [Mytilus edulis]|uniref:Uncharacterized protein n=1 Tax=Mytilus edulis TaxID=6550 RepID=A0A8S3VG64_MYTED|nr:unnamed protein product [Mytilus edulis]
MQHIDIQEKCRAFLEDAGCEVEGVNMIKCYQFASHHFTNWRNQLRIKLVNGNGKAVQGLDFKALGKITFSPFKVGLETEAMKKANKEIVVGLRAFMEANAWCKEIKEFWNSFRQFITTLRCRENQGEYWKKLTAKHIIVVKEMPIIHNNYPYTTIYCSIESATLSFRYQKNMM